MTKARSAAPESAPPLARALSKLGLARRSRAHALIRAGRVTVNGRVVTDAAMRVPLSRARIAVDGRAAAPNKSVQLIALNKPRGVVTTPRETHLLVTLTRGRNRERRRLFDDVGHEVTRLHRIRFGEVELGNLQPGQWRAIAVPSRIS